MSEEMRNEVVDNLEDDMDQDYISALNEMKKNTVSKDKYQKLLEENRKLLKNVVNTPYNEEEQQQEEKPKDLNLLRKDLFNQEHSNLEYAQKALELRDELIKQGQRDPFLPYGQNISPDKNDVECAERVATVLKECIDFADGDSELFTNELSRRMVDVKIRK